MSLYALKAVHGHKLSVIHTDTKLRTIQNEEKTTYTERTCNITQIFRTQANKQQQQQQHQL